MLFDLLRDVFRTSGRRAARPVATEALAAYERLKSAGRLFAFDYPYRPRPRQWRVTPGMQRLARAIEAGEPRYAALLQEFARLAPELSEIPVEPRSSSAPFWDNGWLPGLDAISLCGLLKKHRPRLYMEVGSGTSTKFARWTIDRFGLDTRLISIDPTPRAEIDALCDEMIRMPCEEAPASVFAQLAPSDLLFVDNSHRAFPSSDVTVFFMEILPGLPPGLLYGLHDIFLPEDYPGELTPRMYNEQYLLAAYLLGGANGDEVLLPNAWVSRNAGLIRVLDPLWSNPRLAGIQSDGAMFWMRAGGLAS